MATTTRTKKTLADYLRLPDDVRVELFEGEFFVTTSPGFKHQNASVNLASELRAHVRRQDFGRVLAAPFDVVLSEENVVQPDILFVATGHLGKIQERLIGAPDLAIEIISSGHAERDRIVKRDLYRKYGVREYWLVDCDAQTIEVLALDGGAWRLHGVFGLGDDITSTILTSLRLPLDQVFA